MDIRYSALARKYAQAFLNIYMDEITLDDCQNLVELKYFLKAHKDVLFFIGLHHINYDEKIVILDRLADSFNLGDHIKKLFEVLVRQGRFHIIIDVLRKICSIYRQRKNVMLFVIESPCELEQKARDILKEFLARSTGSTIICVTRQNSELIAGLRMQSDNYLWEHSVIKQLRNLSQTISNQ